ncbi:hypothetical protein [Achromobacter xylosoxidans]|uniref:hypothetical protein n=1 Tax=Alcaligenes xylosoxydans xylosoxydans TaxID=85698 RepID=UPI001178C853|nr:hypothetical protein [Achromobacter xylosoxidans]
MATLHQNYESGVPNTRHDVRATVPDIPPILKKRADGYANARMPIRAILDQKHLAPAPHSR